MTMEYNKYRTMCNMCGKIITENEGINKVIVNGCLSDLCDECTKKYCYENNNKTE